MHESRLVARGTSRLVALSVLSLFFSMALDGGVPGWSSTDPRPDPRASVPRQW